jgi:hypothetical protein
MGSRRRLRFVFARGSAVVVLGLVAMLGGSASPALADSVTQLPSGINDPWMTVDPAGQHVFVSSGIGGSSIVVLNFDGSIAATITGEQGASQMALDSATHTLYVALYNSSAISEIDTQTLTETTRFSTAPFASPYSLVIAGGKLWFAGLGSPGYAASAGLDGTGIASAAGIVIPGDSVRLAAGGANDQLLATVNALYEPARLALYDVSSGSATPVQGPASDPGGTPCEVADFSVNPAGTSILFASPCQTYVAGLATDPLGTSIDYPSGSRPAAVAWSPDGQYVAEATNDPTFNPDTVELFPTGSTQPQRAWSLYTGVVQRGLAFSPDGSELFVITGGSGGHLNFQVLSRNTPPDTEITRGPSGSVYETGALFDFISSESPLSTFQCNLDGAGWHACTPPVTVFPAPLVGSHTFQVRAVLGNLIDPVGASQTWTILGSDVKITSAPTDPSYAPDVTFGLASDDPGVGSFECSLDGSDWRQCFSSVSYTGLAPGSHTLNVQALHSNGLPDPIAAALTRTWTLLPGGKSLDVKVSGPGFGSVTSTPAGITHCAIFCEAWFAGGSQITLAETPVLGSRFVGWSGACKGTAKCHVTLNQAKSVTATFVFLPKVKLTVSKAGVGKGTVSSKPSGINCGATCTHPFRNGTGVTLTAKAAYRSVFTGWSGGGCHGTGACVVTMSAAKKVKATFSH